MGEFSINFGEAKELELHEEGNYELVIHDYKTAEAQKVESRAKGFNIRLQFKIADRPDLDSLIVYHNLWVQKDNPFAAKAFFEALSGESLDDEFDEDYVTDPSNFLGEHVGAFLSHDFYKTRSGKDRKNIKIQAYDDFYSVD
ncbi:hypothetical protein EHM76_07140 [bacterium]|nr:MAG: hypothetical protein EHM76_07140 [bacterium]